MYELFNAASSYAPMGLTQIPQASSLSGLADSVLGQYGNQSAAMNPSQLQTPPGGNWISQQAPAGGGVGGSPYGFSSLGYALTAPKGSGQNPAWMWGVGQPPA